MESKKKSGIRIAAIILVIAALCTCGIFAGVLLVRNNNLMKDKEKLLAKMDAMQTREDGQDATIEELNQQLHDITVAQEDENTVKGSSKFTKEYPEFYAYDKEKGDKKTIYLTFDDGPSDLTPKVLDVLDKYHAKATFFVVYTDNQEYTKYLQEIVDRGHTLAIHSYTHNYGKIYQSEEAYMDDLSKVFDWVYDNTGVRPSLFRFPGGSTRAGKQLVSQVGPELARRGFTYYDWNVSSGDGSNLTTAENEIDNVCKNAKMYETPVVLMHDGTGKTETLKALPTILENLSNQGCEFKALTDENKPVQYILTKNK